jgi:hypothetical protein
MIARKKPELEMERRVHFRIHFAYTLEEQQDIWRCLWLASRGMRYGECTAQWFTGSLCVAFAITALWQFHPNAVWLAIILPFSIGRALRNYRLCAWYRIKLATLTRGNESYYQRLDELLAEAKADVDGEEPTIVIEVPFDPEELP